MNDFDGWLFFLMSLAVFRLTRLIVFDKITEFLRMPFLDEIEEKDEEGNIEIYLVPKQKGIRKWFGELLNCYWCTGIWVSIFLVVFYHFYPTIAEPIIVILAVAACGAILETLNSFLLDK